MTAGRLAAALKSTLKLCEASAFLVVGVTGAALTLSLTVGGDVLLQAQDFEMVSAALPHPLPPVGEMAEAAWWQFLMFLAAASLGLLKLRWWWRRRGLASSSSLRK